MAETREWIGSNISNGPSRRAQGVAAASKALQLVRGLDVRLDELRPRHDEVSPDAPLGLAWSLLIGAVARAEIRGDELVVAAKPFAGTKNRPFTRRQPKAG